MNVVQQTFLFIYSVYNSVSADYKQSIFIARHLPITGTDRDELGDKIELAVRKMYAAAYINCSNCNTPEPLNSSFRKVCI